MAPITKFSGKDRLSEKEKRELPIHKQIALGVKPAKKPVKQDDIQGIYHGNGSKY